MAAPSVHASVTRWRHDRRTAAPGPARRDQRRARPGGSARGPPSDHADAADCGAARRGRHRPARPEDRLGRAQRDARRLPRLRRSAECRRSPCSARHAPRRTTRLRRRGMSPPRSRRRAGWSSPGRARASCRRPRRAPARERSLGVLDPPPVRGEGERGRRRAASSRRDEVLLHPQADADEGVARVRLPARRVRHAGRDVRAAHAAADRQGRADADRAARPARRHVLARARPLREGGSRAHRGHLARRLRPRPGHRLGDRGGDGRSPASGTTTIRCAGSATCSCCACARSRPTPRSTA